MFTSGKGHLLSELKETLSYLILGFWLCSISLLTMSAFHLEAAENIIHWMLMNVYASQNRKKSTGQGTGSSEGINGSCCLTSQTGLASQPGIESNAKDLASFGPLWQFFSVSQGIRIADWHPQGTLTLLTPRPTRVPWHRSLLPKGLPLY